MLTGSNHYVSDTEQTVVILLKTMFHHSVSVTDLMWCCSRCERADSRTQWGWEEFVTSLRSWRLQPVACSSSAHSSLWLLLLVPWLQNFTRSTERKRSEWSGSCFEDAFCANDSGKCENPLCISCDYFKTKANTFHQVKQGEATSIKQASCSMRPLRNQLGCPLPSLFLLRRRLPVTVWIQSRGHEQTSFRPAELQNAERLLWDFCPLTPKINCLPQL